MNVTALDKIMLLGSMYSVLRLLPSFFKKISTFFRPIDTTRFFEFAYMIKFMKKNDLHDLDILDISSPHMMAYYLSKKNRVLKTNIDIDEKKFIKENKNLTFKLEDATRLSFPDNTFDMTYSISVIEHIYKEYSKAISEMIRVTKNGGYIYLTFPVAEKYKEEWLDGYVYSNQFSKERKTFFFYRFSESEINYLLNQLQGVQILYKDIFWERTIGLFDSVIRKLNFKLKNKYINFIMNIFINNYYGFTMFPSKPVMNFPKGKLFGNIHLILKKD